MKTGTLPRIMDASVIIVNYNTKTLIKQCLDSLFEHTKDIEFEVIVVDNASTDESLEMLHQYFPHVMVIENNDNIGFGRANNLGAKNAKGRYLFLLNPDTILQNNAIKILSDFLDTTPRAGICGGNLYDRQGLPNHSYYMLLPSITWELCIKLSKYPLKIRYGKNMEFNHTSKARKVAMITGADLMIRSQLFADLGGFDPEFFTYYEDTELSFRVKKAGYDIYNVPQAKIIHLEGQSFTKLSGRRKELNDKSRRLYYLKTHGKLYNALVFRIIETGYKLRKLFSINSNRK